MVLIRAIMDDEGKPKHKRTDMGHHIMEWFINHLITLHIKSMMISFGGHQNSTGLLAGVGLERMPPLIEAHPIGISRNYGGNPLNPKCSSHSL